MTEPDRPVSRTLGGLLEELAARGPGRPAILHRGGAITYRELWSEAVAAAKALLSLGVRRGDRVGVLMGNQPEWMTTCFGAAAIGATCVPLNTWYKRDEIEWTLRHCGVKVLVGTASFLKHDYLATFRDLVPELDRAEPGAIASSRLPQLKAIGFIDGIGGPRWSDIRAAGAGIADERFWAAAAEVTPDDIALILYTSGSTAEPKGVLLRHGSLIENGFDTGTRRQITEQDVVWLGAPLFYGLGAANAMPATITHGAALVLQDYFEAGRAIETIQATRATVYYGAGAGNMSQAIVDHPSFSKAKLATLERGNAGMSAAFKRITLIEMGIHGATGAYGLTETYGHATGHHPDDPLDVKLNTNGTALPGFEIVIVDPDNGRRLGPGETGLVLVGGHVTAGYYDAPEQTADVIRADGFLDTGDLGHLDAGGRLVFHSRLKSVIKSGGINISPLEIEQILSEHPDIRDVHVLGVPDPVRGEVPVAFVHGRAALREDDVKDYVRERVASFKVPHRILFRTEFPRLSSGKVAGQLLAEEALRELAG